MNWIAFAVVIPTAIALAIADLFTAYFVSRKTALEQRELWGSLYHPRLFALSSCTFVISFFGCCASFFLFTMTDQPEYASLCVFAVWNVSTIVFDWAVLHERKHVVLACLLTNAVCGISLFVYTGVVFDLFQTTAQKPFVLATHCCNAVTVFHVAIVDLVIWYDGWASLLRAREPELTVVWAGETDHAPQPGRLALADQMRL